MSDNQLKNLQPAFLAVLLAAVFATGILVGHSFFGKPGQSAAKENQLSNVEQSSKNVRPVETPPAVPNSPSPESNFSAAAKPEEWCVPSKINFIKDPYVSVHSPQILYYESSLESTSPVASTLDSEAAYWLPFAGKVVLLSQLGVPPQHKVTDLEYQIRVIAPDGKVLYSNPFAVKEALTYELDKTLVYGNLNTFNIEKDGIASFDAGLKYKIDGVGQTQCTPQNKIPFASPSSYSIPSVGSVNLGDATYAPPQSGVSVSNNAYANVSFAYSGSGTPSSVELRALSMIVPENKVYLTSTSVKCTDNLCIAVLGGTITSENKKILCASDAIYYLQVTSGNIHRGLPMKVNADAFLKKDFSGCK